jgi:hypothetical protein
MATPINDNINKNIVNNKFSNVIKNKLPFKTNNYVNQPPPAAIILNKNNSNIIDNYANQQQPVTTLNKNNSNIIDNYANQQQPVTTLNKNNSNIIDNYANPPQPVTLNKNNSNIIDNYANQQQPVTTLNNKDSNIINNNVDLSGANTLDEKLNNMATDNDPNRSTLNTFRDTIKSIGASVNDVSELLVTTGAEIATIGIKGTTNTARMEGIAASNAATDLLQTASYIAKTKLPDILDNVKEVAETAINIAKTKLPDLIRNIKDVSKIIAEGVGEINNIINITKLEIKEGLLKDQVAMMLASNPGLTEEQAKVKLEEEEKIKEEETKRVQELELEKTKAEAISKQAEALEIASQAKIAAASGGSVKQLNQRTSLKNIQKGGKMSATRTQKSIRDFLKPSITSSTILKIIKGRRKSIKKRRDNCSNKRCSKRLK